MLTHDTRGQSYADLSVISLPPPCPEQQDYHLLSETSVGPRGRIWGKKERDTIFCELRDIR